MTSKILFGDCLKILPLLPESSVDTIITDPPYGLSFMDAKWDHDVPGPPFWEAALRVAKPGAFMLAFGGTRTFHRLAVAIEDAGWVLRDTVMWVYGSGFPKGQNISKALDRRAGVERPVVGHNPNHRESQATSTKHNLTANAAMNQHTGDGSLTAPATPEAAEWDGWFTGLKPAWEPIIVAMKPPEGTFAENALKYGVAGLNIDGGRVAVDMDVDDTRLGGNGAWTSQARSNNRCTGDYAGAVVRSSPGGRHPANLIHDGSPDVLDCFPGEQGRFFYCAKAQKSERDAGLEGMESGLIARSGGAQQAVKDGKETYIQGEKSGFNRVHPAKNTHPTVKPLALMKYLCTLTKTPTGGVVLDPFCGSGTTGAAAILTGRGFIGIEMDTKFGRIALGRLAWARKHKKEKTKEST